MAREFRGGDRAFGGPARVHLLGVGAVREELHQARCHAPGQAGGADGVRERQAEEAGGDRGGRDDAQDGCGVEAALLERLAGREGAQAGGEFVADGGRREDVPSGRAGLLADRQGRGDDHDAWMDHRGGVRVVVVHAVGEHAVGETGVVGSGPPSARGPDRGRAGGGLGQGQAGRGRRAEAAGGAGQGDADRVGDAQGRPGEEVGGDVGGRVAEREVEHPLGEGRFPGAGHQTGGCARPRSPKSDG